jgi:hypothetical protein
MYKANGFSDAGAAQKASDMISSEFIADNIGKLTTYVAGQGGINVNIPTGTKGDQK